MVENDDIGRFNENTIKYLKAISSPGDELQKSIWDMNSKFHAIRKNGNGPRQPLISKPVISGRRKSVIINGAK